MKFGAVILAGGKSSRMGRDKASLEIGGETLLARQIKLVRKIGAHEVFISGRAAKNYREFGCPVLRDRFIGAGPLAGIERALAAVTSPLLLVVAVDLPALNAEFLQRLLAECADGCGIVPRLAGNVEPLVAVYPKRARAFAENLLGHKQFTVANFARSCVAASLAAFMELDSSEAKYFTNWNSPGDLGAFVKVTETANDRKLPDLSG